jgi:hypothetical protein
LESELGSILREGDFGVCLGLESGEKDGGDGNVFGDGIWEMGGGEVRDGANYGNAMGKERISFGNICKCEV